jgi:two-component system, sensor histidine kinase PdtaS
MVSMLTDDLVKEQIRQKSIMLSFRRAWIAGIIFLVIYIVILLFLQDQPGLTSLFSYTMITLLYSAVTFTLYLATKSSARYGKRVKFAWALLTLAVLTSVIANILWAAVVMVYHQNPINSLADIFYLMFYPLFLIGILIFPSSNTKPRQRLKRYFDILVIMFSIALIFWILLIEPALSNYNGNYTSLVFMLSYVFGGFLLLFSMMDLLFNRIKQEIYAPLLILLAGIVVLIITNIIFVFQSVHGTYNLQSPADIGWLVGYLLIGLAGVSQFNHKTVDLDGFVAKSFSWYKNYALTPYLALAGVSVGYISLIWAYNTYNPNLTFLEFGIGILIFLVVLRQFISINENKHLYWQAKNEIRLRKEISQSLKDSESAYRTIFENTGTATVIIDEYNTITLANSEFERLTGYSKIEIEDKKAWTDFVVSEDLERMKELNQVRLAETGSKPKNYEFRLKDRFGDVKYIYVAAVMIPGSRGSLISLLDVTERKNAEYEIKKSLEEKETLLKEIHHRVKNNLTVISSLLNLQSRYIKDKDDLIMFKESQSRAKSMAFIHQKLYDSSDLKRIDFGDYIKTLANEMFHTYVQDPMRIKMNLDVEDIMLDINTSIPLGLILNELLTNSMKYAFPSDEDLNGVIDVKLYKNRDGYTLSVEDNGVGFPDDIDFKNTNSLGLQLVNTLTHQIDGQIYFNNDNGTSFKIDFKEKEY